MLINSAVGPQQFALKPGKVRGLNNGRSEVRISVRAPERRGPGYQAAADRR
jgi:hypothetical protein